MPYRAGRKPVKPPQMGRGVTDDDGVLDGVIDAVPEEEEVDAGVEVVVAADEGDSETDDERVGVTGSSYRHVRRYAPDTPVS